MKRILLLSAIALSLFFWFREPLSIKKVIEAENNTSALNEEGWKFKKRSSPQDWFQQAFQEKLQKKHLGHTKFERPDLFYEIHQGIRTRDGETIPGYRHNQRNLEFLKAKNRPRSGISARTMDLTFVDRGPGNVPGRTRGMVAFPDDPLNKWVAGSTGGGIWKTEDGGTTWAIKTPNLPNLTISDIKQSESDPNIFYAGTGESPFFGSGGEGSGMYKSSDGGESWEHLLSTATDDRFRNVSRIVINPEDEDHLVVSTTTTTNSFSAAASFILVSRDGGETWEQSIRRQGNITQIVADPDDFNTQYFAQSGFGVFRSTDAGETWSLTSSGLTATGRIELAVSPSNTSRIWASVEGNQSGNASAGQRGSDLFISDDKGDNWFLVEEVNSGDGFNFLGEQGFYDNTIMVSPFTDTLAYFGGVNLFQSKLVGGDSTREGTQSVLQRFGADGDVFFEFINFSGLRPGIGEGVGPDSSRTSFEIRFGEGKSQMAHRFTVEGRTAGVPESDYIYEDFVEVPFEVWDTDNDRQLVVSFRDQGETGDFDLIEAETEDEDPFLQSREYVYIHGLEYMPEPDTNIAQNGGIAYQNSFFLWFTLAEDREWNPESLPDARIFLDFSPLRVRFRSTVVVTDAYEQFNGNNSIGQTFGETEQQDMHPDHHNLIPIIDSNSERTFRILNANDGGVFLSNSAQEPGINDGDWDLRGTGYNTSQFYGIAKRPGRNEFIGGMQDNGTWRSPGGESASDETFYIRQLPGDGFEAVWHNLEPEKIVASFQFNGFGRTFDGGRTWLLATSGIPRSTQDDVNKLPFISRIANSPSNPDVLFALSDDGVFRSDNFAENWVLTPIEEDWGLTFAPDVKVSLANPQIVWAGSAMSEFNKVHVSTDNGLSFQPVNNPEDMVLGNITGIGTHPTEDSTAFILFSFAGVDKVFRTQDLGETWEPITGFDNGEESSNGFPDVAVYSLLVLPHDPSIIWVGTEIGLVESQDNGETWNLVESFPASPVWDMKVQDTEVILGTHGRGVWTVTIPELPEPTFVPFITNVGVSPQNELQILADLKSAYDSTVIFINEERIGSLSENEVGEFLISVDGFDQIGTIRVQLIGYAGRSPFASKLFEGRNFTVTEPAASFGTDFTGAQDDFDMVGMSIRQELGFFNQALNSRHPYERNTEYFAVLKTPIIISEDFSFFQYMDVAIIETGEPGSQFGDFEFWDYVIVEGSTDGVNWRPIAPGYDASKFPEWEEAYQGEENGRPRMYREQSIDLLETFEPGDEVLFRFRLFSDPEVVAWGWIIDDLYIQEAIPVSTDLEEVLELSVQAVPNPVVGSGRLQYTLPERSPDLNIQIIDLSGRMVKEFSPAAKGRGVHQIPLENGSLLRGTYLLRIDNGKEVATTKILIE